jgi:hypothetical protein
LGRAAAAKVKGGHNKAMTPGFLYILRNEQYPVFVVKIGRTTRKSEERAKEISGATGVVGEFQVLFEERVADIALAEKLVHDRLAGYRVQENREFFRVPYKEAIRTVADVCAQVNREAESQVSRVRISVRGAALARRLMGALSPHRGGRALVLLHYENDGATCDVALGEAWKVRLTPELLNSLQDLECEVQLH